MPLRYQPEERAIQLAEKALSMKVSVQAVLDAIGDEKEKYRDRMGAVLDRAEETVLRYSEDESVTDERLEDAQRDREVLGDAEDILERMYGSKERGMESMGDNIDGKVLSALQAGPLFANEETKEDREAALRKMINVAVWQAMELLEFDVYTDSGLVNQAEDIIHDRLGLTQP